MCLYFAPDRNIMLIVIRPFDEILGVFRLSLAKLVEKLLRCHPVSSFKDAETLSYSYKSVYRRIILNSLLPHISSFQEQPHCQKFGRHCLPYLTYHRTLRTQRKTRRRETGKEGNLASQPLDFSAPWGWTIIQSRHPQPFAGHPPYPSFPR